VVFSSVVVAASILGCGADDDGEWNLDLRDLPPFGPCSDVYFDTIEECNAPRGETCAAHEDAASCREERGWDLGIGPDAALRCAWVEPRRIVDDETCETSPLPGFCAVLFQGPADVCNESCAFEERLQGWTLYADPDARTVFRVPCGPEDRVLSGPTVGAPFPGYRATASCYGGNGPELCRCAQVACEAEVF
jgi:hypothetical protein